MGNGAARLLIGALAAPWFSRSGGIETRQMTGAGLTIDR